MFFFYLYIIAVLLFGGYIIGPFSIRVYMVLIMLIHLIVQYSKGKKSSLPISYIYWYIAFILVMALAFLITGEFFVFGFIKFILANHLVCIVTYFAIGLYITDYNKLKGVTKVLVGIMFFTSIITILQYYNNPIGWNFARAFSTSRMSETLSDKLLRFSEESSMLGHSYAMGIFDFAFSNAMFIASTSVLSLYWALRKQEKGGIRLWYLFVFLVGLMGCFATQQRAAFYCLVIISGVIIWENIKNPIFRVILLGFILLVLVYSNTSSPFFENEELGRMSAIGNFEKDSRYMMWQNAIRFIGHNVFGGPLAFILINNNMPAHNFIFNAFIYGGLFGGTIVIILFIKMLAQIFKSIKKRNLSTSKYLSSLYALELLIFFICGMFHNSSLVFGSVLIFVLFPLMMCDRNFWMKNHHNQI